ncbi:MAG: hypothetical protein IPK13_06130 [Deltaproteobacteria bacterium]|nr:hypothetical protein [Deltaproteobacteria bacterium]
MTLRRNARLATRRVRASEDDGEPKAATEEGDEDEDEGESGAGAGAGAGPGAGAGAEAGSTAAGMHSYDSTTLATPSSPDRTWSAGIF